MVLFIGNLVPVKGLETLVKACAILHAAAACDFNVVSSARERWAKFVASNRYRRA